MCPSNEPDTVWFHHLKLEVVYERNNFRVPLELTKVQNVAIAIPESPSEPLSLGCNADRQLACPLSACQQWLFSATHPCSAKLKRVCELKDVLCVNMVEHLRKCGCSLHYVWKPPVCKDLAHVCSTDQTVKGKKGKYRLTENLERNQEPQE